jgi:hypothetical protein
MCEAGGRPGREAAQSLWHLPNAALTVGPTEAGAAAMEDAGIKYEEVFCSPECSHFFFGSPVAVRRQAAPGVRALPCA